MAIDDGPGIDYAAVTRGTPVYSSDEQQVGVVDAILDNHEERIFDGVVIETPEGKLLFADAPEVQRTAERGVTLAITAAEASELPPPEKGAPRFKARSTGRVGRMLGRNWKRH